jgi:catechol 2,3-dioxygenase-like lactoylglutathione lyase family enzyme
VAVTRMVHANVVCSSLEKSLAFYIDVLGGQVHQRIVADQTDLRPCMGVDDSGAPFYRAALVYFGGARGGPYLDLVEWSGAALHGRRDPLGAQDLGLARVALEVDDLSKHIERLDAHGFPPVGPPQEEKIGPWTLRLALFRDPDGTLVELVEFPEGQRREVAATAE